MMVTLNALSSRAASRPICPYPCYQLFYTSPLIFNPLCSLHNRFFPDEECEWIESEGLTRNPAVLPYNDFEPSAPLGFP
jgi:hypothetical protein